MGRGRPLISTLECQIGEIILGYCIQVWCTCFKKDREKVECRRES